MNRLRRLSRLTQVLGLLVALTGLLGYWLTRDVQRTVLSAAEASLLNPEGTAFQASFVVAGRDLYYDEPAGELVWREGKLVREFVTEGRPGHLTDTVIYVNLVGNRAYMVSIPRDTYLPQFRQQVATLEQAKVNAVYTSGKHIFGEGTGGDHLRRAVADLLDVPVDYYVVVSLDIFKELVDAVGGVELNVPIRMEHSDLAAGLEIDLYPGLQRLDGEAAAGFVRFRDTLRGDIDRIDNIKTLTLALLRRLQELNVRAVGTLPELARTYFDTVETNLSPALLGQLMGRLNGLELQATTLPTSESVIEEAAADAFRRINVLSYAPEEVETFLATLFGGAAREVTRAPEGAVMITNRSGIPGLGAAVRRELITAGVPAERLETRQGELDAVSRVVVTNASLSAAPYYADLLGVGWQQVDRFSFRAEVELILGSDARTFDLARRFAQQGGNDFNPRF